MSESSVTNVETEEKIASEELRLRQTLLTQKPRRSSAVVAVSTLAILALGTQLAWWDPSGLGADMAISQATFKQDWWRAVTALLVHADLAHFLSNGFSLCIFCFFIYGHFGWVLFPGLTLPAAALVNIFTVMTYPPDVRLVGASGLVYILGGLWLTLYALIQRQFSWASRIMRVLGISAMLFFPSKYEPSTSYTAHAYGFFVGIILGLIYFLWNRQSIRNNEVYSADQVPVRPGISNLEGA
jgi:rhomboid protease GluP